MPEPEGPKVVLRGPAEGESIILPMGRQRARITRKASRTETGGHWAIGEAWQDPGFDNPPHTHDEAEAFYVLEGSYTFYTGTAPAEGVGPGTFVFIPPGAVSFIPLTTEVQRRNNVRASTVRSSTDGPSRTSTRQCCLGPIGWIPVMAPVAKTVPARTGRPRLARIFRAVARP
jgi:mannose-6-phosphate isomerase-like protein (cupin superfamily)